MAMLHADPFERISAMEALHLPFFKPAVRSDSVWSSEQSGPQVHSAAESEDMQLAVHAVDSADVQLENQLVQKATANTVGIKVKASAAELGSANSKLQIAADAKSQGDTGLLGTYTDRQMTEHSSLRLQPLSRIWCQLAAAGPQQCRRWQLESAAEIVQSTRGGASCSRCLLQLVLADRLSLSCDHIFQLDCCVAT